MLSNEPAPSEAEIELVQSTHGYMGKTVDELQLDQKSKPPISGFRQHDSQPQRQRRSDFENRYIYRFRRMDQQTLQTDRQRQQNYILTLRNGTAKEGRVGTPLKINNETVLKVDQILAETEQDSS